LHLPIECALFVAGLAFGSFLNVCISRIPSDLSIVAPPSHCPHCLAAIRWRDNVPLLSWIVLRGRCRDCGHRISPRYPAVELLTASLFVACYACFGPAWLTLKACVFCFLIVGLIFMDAETGLLPHEFTYSGIALGLVLAWVAPTDSSATAVLAAAIGLRFSPGPQLSLLDATAAAVLGAGFFYLTWALYYLVRKRHGIGFGDIALIAMVGAFLGLKLTVLVVFLAPILAIVFVLGALLLSRNRGRKPRSDSGQFKDADAQQFLSREVPFGVFLGASSLAALFLGTQIWSWYWGLVR